MVSNVVTFGSIAYMKLNCKNVIDDYYLGNDSIRFYQDESADNEISNSVEKENPDTEIEILAYKSDVEVLNRTKTTGSSWKHDRNTSTKKRLKLGPVEQESFDRGVKGCRVNCLIDSMRQRERAGYAKSREARVESDRNLKLIRCLKEAGNRSSEEDCFMVHVIFRAKQLEHLRLASDRERRGIVADNYFEKYKVREQYTPATTRATIPKAVSVTEKIPKVDRSPWTHEAFRDRGPWEPIYENECKFRCEDHWVRLYVEMSKEVGPDSRERGTTTPATISKESTDNDDFDNVVWTSTSRSEEKSTDDGLESPDGEENAIKDESGEYGLSNESKSTSVPHDHGSQDEQGSEERKSDGSHRKKHKHKSHKKKDKHGRKHGKAKTTTTEQTNSKFEDYDDDHLGYDRSDSSSDNTDLETTHRNDVQSTTEGTNSWDSDWSTSTSSSSERSFEKNSGEVEITSTTPRNDLQSTTEGNSWWSWPFWKDGDGAKSSSQNSKPKFGHSGNSVELDDSRETVRTDNPVGSYETSSARGKKKKKKGNGKSSERYRERITSTDVTTQATTTEGYSESPCPGSEQHLCGDGMCVDYDNVCDRNYDCDDHTDEVGCDFFFNNLEGYDYGLDGDETPTKSYHAEQETTTKDSRSSTTDIITTTDTSKPSTVTRKKDRWSILDSWWGDGSTSAEDESGKQTTKRPATTIGSDESEEKPSTTEKNDSRWSSMGSREDSSSEKVSNEITTKSEDEWMNSALRVTAGPTSTVSESLTTTTSERTTQNYATTRRRPEERLKENYNAYNFTFEEYDHSRNYGRGNPYARRPGHMELERQRMELIRNRKQEEEQRRMREEQDLYRMRDEIERRKWEMERQSHEILETLKRINYLASRRNHNYHGIPPPARTQYNQKERITQGRPSKELQM